MANKRPLTVLKIGGAILDNPLALQSFYDGVKHLSGAKIIIHGGGNRASQIQTKMGITPEKINGRRVTDAQSLEIITMVYAGLLNKQLVAGLQALGKNAMGLSGADGDAVRAHKRVVNEVDYGFAGDIDSIHASFLHSLLDLGIIPVFSAITHDGKGQLLNTNADTLAAEISKAMSSLYHVQLLYVFDKPGVLENVTDPSSIMERIDQITYLQMLDKNLISEGMLPKLHTAFNALENGVLQVHLGTTKIIKDIDTKHTTLCL